MGINVKCINNEMFTSTNKSSQENTIKDSLWGSVEVASGSYLGAKALASGLPRIAGIRIETHITTKKASKSIIKDGCILDPQYGGTNGASSNNTKYIKDSKNFVHITGIHQEKYKELESLFGLNFHNKKSTSKLVADTTLNNLTRNIQQIIYKYSISRNTPNIDNSKSTCPQSSMIDTITGRKIKSFYIGGTDNYFNTNFIPDPNDYALKTNKPLKVSTSKFGATLSALKREGLSGIKQNLPRCLAGIGITVGLGYCAYKLINLGLKNLKVIN